MSKKISVSLQLYSGYLLCVIHVCRLLQYTSLFLRAFRCIGSPVGTLLKEIFTGGPTITLKVKEEQIVQMLHFVFTQNESSEEPIDGKMSMILALQELVKVLQESWMHLLGLTLTIYRSKSLIFH